MHHPETPYHSPSKVCPSEHTNIQEQVLQENTCPEQNASSSAVEEKQMGLNLENF